MHANGKLTSNLAAALGFEPRQTESESAVLPLHNAALPIPLYNFLKYTSSLISRNVLKRVYTKIVSNEE